MLIYFRSDLTLLQSKKKTLFLYQLLLIEYVCIRGFKHKSKNEKQHQSKNEKLVERYF